MNTPLLLPSVQILLLAIVSLTTVYSFEAPIRTVKGEKPKVCITFDDGNPVDMPGYSWQQWNDLILAHLQEQHLQAMFFAFGQALDNPEGKQILTQWSKAGHLIANYTYSHKSYNSKEVTFEGFVNDFVKNDSLIGQFSTYSKFFRFPYLKEGNTIEKRDQFRDFLKKQGYRNGYVTIDASDWYINSRLLKRLKENPKADMEPFKQFYLQHLFERATYYNELALQLTGRQISHSLLLHHNLTSALFVDDLIKMFKAKGWEVINAEQAYTDPIYKKAPTTLPAGESLIWALAKERGSYKQVLRYPAEDAQYEEKKMDQLGL